jgi:hypothetical protein
MIVTPEKCLNDFIRYQKKAKSFNKDGKLLGTTIELLSGLESDKPGYIHESINEYSTFEDKPIKVPKGYKKISKKKLNQIALDFYCKKSKSKNEISKHTKKLNNKLKGALHFEKWYDVSRKHWLTIKDIEKLTSKDKIVVLPLHRNVLDGPMTKYKKNTAYTPATFFKKEKDTFIHHGNLEGIFKQYDKHDKQPKGLDVEYKKDNWCPIFDGRLSKGKKHWSKLPKKTHVGLKGPMILWTDLKKLPKLYFDENV